MGDEGQSQDVADAKPIKDSEQSKDMPIPNRGYGEPVMSADDFFSDTYKMDYPNRGRAVIINNRRFAGHLNLGERVGTDRDAISLHQRFSEIGFQVEMYNDLKVATMLKVLKEAADDYDYNCKSDCFACAVLTHGEEGIVYGADDKFETKLLFEHFKGNKCKGLVGKPKLFFIQACQGDQFDGGKDVNVYDAKGKMPGDRDNIQVHKIPSEADFLIAYSVVPGFFSWRNSSNGSWFIQALSEVLTKHWRDMDLLTIMTRVNKKVAFDFESKTGKAFMNEKKQIPCVTSMLTKEVWFKPKE